MTFIAKLIIIMIAAAIAAVCLPNVLGGVGGVVFVASAIVLASYVLFYVVSGLFSLLASVAGVVLMGLGIVVLLTCALVFLPLLPVILILGCVGLVMSIVCGVLGVVF